jgi:hypothetical protein
MHRTTRILGLWIAVIGVMIAVDTASAQTRAKREPSRQNPQNPQDRGRSARARSTAPRSGTIRHASRSSTVRRDRTHVATRNPRYTRIVRPSGHARIVSIHRPTYGTVIARPLPSFRRVVVGGGTYFVDRDVYYVQRDERYVVVPPPAGSLVRYLPEHCDEVVIGGSTYYYEDDTYYVEDSEVEIDIDIDDDDFEIEIDIEKEKNRKGGYRVIEPPVGAYIYQLPEVYRPVVVRDVTYYRYNDIYYRPVLREGRAAYLRVDLRF